MMLSAQQLHLGGQGAATARRAVRIASLRSSSTRHYVHSSRSTAVVVKAAQTSSVVTSGTEAVKAGTIALRKAAASAAYKGQNVVVIGGQGLLAVRLIKDLLTAGFKVTATVPDLEEGQAVVDFVKRYELIERAPLQGLKLVELDGEDPNTLRQLPKRSKVVVVEGDGIDKNRIGQREVADVLDIAKETQASLFVLVSTSAATGTTGGFAFFGGSKPQPGKASDKLDRTEQMVADSGVPYAIVRGFGTERVDDDYPGSAFTAVGPLGTFPNTQPASRAQVAGAVTTLLMAPSIATGVVVEVAGSTSEQRPVADNIAVILDAAAARAAEEKRAADAERAKQLAALGGLFGFGAKPKEAAKEEAPAPAASKKGTSVVAARGSAAAAAAERPTGSATLSARRAYAAKVAAAEAEKEAKPAAGGFFGFGGTGTTKAKVATKQEEEEEEEEKPKAGGFFGFGSGSTKKPAPKEEEEEEEEKPKAGGFFGFGSGSTKKPAEAETPAKSGTGTASRARAAAPAAPSKAGTATNKPGTATTKPGTGASKPGTQQKKASPPARKGGDNFVYIE